MAELSILVPGSEQTLIDRFNQIRGFEIDYSPLDCEIPKEIDVKSMLEFIASIREDSAADFNFPYSGRSPEYPFVRGGREKVLGTVEPPKESGFYGSLERAANLLNIPIIGSEETKNDNLHLLYAEVHLLDSVGVSLQVLQDLGWETSAIYYIFPAQGYLEQEVVQEALKGLYPKCNGNSSGDNPHNK